MADLPQAIREWLTEYKTLSPEEVNTYSSTVRQNDELVSCLYHLFKSETDSQVLDPICHQLFEFYRSNQPGLRLFALEFIPTLQWVYLSSLSVNGKKIGTPADVTVAASHCIQCLIDGITSRKFTSNIVIVDPVNHGPILESSGFDSCGGVEALLLAAYNLDIVSSDGKPKIKTFRIPSFGQPSVYHEPSALSSLSLSESALSRYDHTEPEIWRSGPYPQYEAINGQNRQSILSYLLQCYNSCISDLSELSHQMYCKACSRLATTGFDDLSDISCSVKPSASFHLQDSPPPQSKRKSHVGELLPRIAISPTLMTEMVSGLYYIMFNSDKYLATRAILDIHNRASYELFPDVLLVTTAIKNSLPAGHEEDGPMGLMTVTPSSSGHTIAKSAITNASFRTKKLPDDIDIIEGDENLSKLETIDEDSDTPTKSLGKLPKLADKFKMGIKKMDKSKVKEHKRDSDVSRTLSNGDTIDSVQVNVIKNNSRSSVDNVEMTSLTNKKNSILEEINEEKVGSSPLGNLRQKHSSSSLKEMKNKPGHTRHSSGSSVNTENCSTDL